uniref:Uncharacterized protein n=1 Tax=Anguilla anguilla TaxID=7936 RepID=A0A0E9QGY0_ANGAN
MVKDKKTAFCIVFILSA